MMNYFLWHTYQVYCHSFCELKAASNTADSTENVMKIFKKRAQKAVVTFRNSDEKKIN